MKKLHLLFMVGATMALASTTLAGVAASGKAAKDVVEEVKESWITGDIGIDIYSQYVFRGVVLENQGAILQPYTNIYMKLYEGEGWLNDITLNLGIWNSLHSNHTVPSSTRWWYEFDFLAGVSFTLAKNLTITPSYIAYTSPGDYFLTAHAAQLKIAYNDEDLLGAFALHPYALVEAELENKSGNGADEGFYYEVGISPGTSAGPVSISFPLKAGFGSNDYYAGDAGYGYFAGGIALGYTLPMPEKLGVWTVSASATYYHFGDACDDATSVKNADDSTVVFAGGLKIAF